MYHIILPCLRFVHITIYHTHTKNDKWTILHNTNSKSRRYKQTNKKMSNNDEKDDDQQQQNITDEMEQKRLEEAAASVEWVFWWCAIYFYTCVRTIYHMKWKGWRGGVKKMAPISFHFCCCYCTHCIFVCFFISFICLSPKIFANLEVVFMIFIHNVGNKQTN